jgi:hypothetical protein
MSKNSPLNEISQYGELLSYYNDNKDKSWKEWLDFDSVFTKPGKQGIVGLLNQKTNKKYKYVFKISQYIDYLVQHENVIMKGLNEISPYCPHFCKTIGTILCDIDSKYKKTKNPFNITSKYPIQKEVLLCEYIDKSYKLYNYIRSEKISEDILYSTVKQVLLGIAIAQKKKQFSHYDLHSFNIMMKKCNKDVVFLYVFDESNQFCVPTFGHYPIIIDFGFSYINNMEDGPLWATLAHTDVGFISDRFDWVADPKLFLVSVSKEITKKRKSKKSRRLRRIVKNIFQPLKIDWDCGWDDLNDKGAADYVTDMLKDYNDCSQLFEDYDHYCIDILQSLIILPLEEQDYSNITSLYSTWLKQWVKIENEISNPFYNLYILKGVVDAARTNRADYSYLKTRSQAIKSFRTAIYERVNQVSKFCTLKDIHFEKMLCSLLLLSKNIEGVLYDVVSTRMVNKQKEYNKMILKSTEQIYGAIEANIPDEYVYNENTTIFIMDSINESCRMYKIPSEQLEYVNNTHPMARGTFIYDMEKIHFTNFNNQT